MARLDAGGVPARTDLTRPSALTAAESPVCRQPPEGQINREIARVPFVVDKTVERYHHRAYQKLGSR